MTLEVEVIMPKGYDPDGPNASREEYARLLAAEARQLYSSIERFVVIFATIRDQRLYQMLGYATIQEFAFKEYGVSQATAQRWVVQGRAIAEIDQGDGSSVGLSREARPSNPTVPLQRVTDEARLSQREAARQAQAAREQSEERRKAREAQEAARKAKRESEERRRAEVEAAEPEVLVARPVAPRSSPERVARMSARETLNRLLGIIESVDDGRVLVNAATAAERSTIAAFGALFTRKPLSAEVVSEKDCIHPVGRRLGKDCGMCGARNVGGKK